MKQRILKRLSRRIYSTSDAVVKHDVRRLSRRAYSTSDATVKHDVRRLTVH